MYDERVHIPHAQYECVHTHMHQTAYEPHTTQPMMVVSSHVRHWQSNVQYAGTEALTLSGLPTVPTGIAPTAKHIASAFMPQPPAAEWTSTQLPSCTPTHNLAPCTLSTTLFTCNDRTKTVVTAVHAAIRQQVEWLCPLAVVMCISALCVESRLRCYDHVSLR